jgi:hypothetical protein
MLGKLDGILAQMKSVEAEQAALKEKLVKLKEANINISNELAAAKVSVGNIQKELDEVILAA